MTRRSGPLLLLAASMLAAAMPLPAHAFIPPPPPKCAPVGPAVSVGDLGAVLAGGAPIPAQQCAVIELVRRGPAAAPVAAGLLGTGDADSARLALQVLVALGPQAHAALPALMSQIGTPSAALRGNLDLLYEAVGALGAAGKPAIPLLIGKLREPAYRSEAVDALGRLGRYDAGRVVPQLNALLATRPGALAPLDEAGLLFALAQIGREARGALPAVLAALERARVAGDALQGGAALHALAAIGEAGECVPVLTGLIDHPVLGESAVNEFAAVGSAAASAAPLLIDKLQRSRGEAGLADGVVRALAAIAPASPSVQRQLLEEATRHGSAQAAAALARITSLPPDFAPPLAAALAKNPGSSDLRRALANARRAN